MCMIFLASEQHFPNLGDSLAVLPVLIYFESFSARHHFERIRCWVQLYKIKCVGQIYRSKVTMVIITLE